MTTAIARRNGSPVTMFDKMFDDFLTDDWFFNRGKRSYVNSTYEAEIINYEDKTEIMYPAVGYGKEDLSIYIENGQLVISGNLQNEAIADKKFVKKQFKLSWVIDDSLYDVENISSTFDRGILTVTLPTKEKAKPKRIDIKIN